MTLSCMRDAAIVGARNGRCVGLATGGSPTPPESASCDAGGGMPNIIFGAI